MSWHVDAVLFAPFERENREAILAPFYSPSRSDGLEGEPNAGLAEMVCQQRETSSPTVDGVYGAEFNHVLPEHLIAHLQRIPWKCPEMVFLLLRVEGGDEIETWRPSA